MGPDHALACNALLLLRFYSSTRTPPRQGSSHHVQVSLLGPACSPIRFRPVAHGSETAAVRAALPLAPADVATTPGLGVSTTGMGPTSAEPRSAHRALGRCCDGLDCALFEQVPPVCGHPGRSSPPPWACMWAMPPPSHPNPSSGVCVCPTASHRHTPWSPCPPRCQGSNRRPCAAPPSQLLRRPCIPYLS